MVDRDTLFLLSLFLLAVVVGMRLLSLLFGSVLVAVTRYQETRHG